MLKPRHKLKHDLYLYLQFLKVYMPVNIVSLLNLVSKEIFQYAIYSGG